MSQQHGGEKNNQSEANAGAGQAAQESAPEKQPSTAQLMPEPMPTSIWKVPGFTSTMVAIASAYGAFSLLLPLLPLAVLDAGGSATLAGGATGAFMAATVAIQIFTPKLIRKYGYNPVMMVSAFMLGVPALGHLLGMDAWIVLLFSALRGVGFGALTVAQAALIAEFVPIRLLGKATGILGVFVGSAQMVFMPLGLMMGNAWGYHTVYILAAVTALIAVAMIIRLPKLFPASVDDENSGVVHVSMWKLVLVPALAMTSISMSYGVVSSFLPASVREADPEMGAVLAGFMLSLIGAMTFIFRLVSGLVADRVGKPGVLMIPMQFLGLFSMLLMAVATINGWSIWWLVLAALLFGAAFGGMQNEALLSMFDRLPRNKFSEASAVWNIFYDAGTGLGSLALGALVAGYGYGGTYLAAAGIVLLIIFLTSLDAYIGKHRTTEYHHIRHRLRQVPGARTAGRAWRVGRRSASRLRFGKRS